MENATNREVTVVDIRMPFGSMVVFMVKWVIASIPALIILAALWMVFLAVTGGLLHALGMAAI